MTERIERTEDLFLIDMGVAPPVEEGQIRQANGDIVAFIAGEVKSLTAGAGTTLLGRAVFKTDGGLVYTTAGAVVIKVVQ
jgi:hypothetical protein